VRRPRLRVKLNPVGDALIRYFAIGLAAVVLISLLGAWLFRRAGQAEAIKTAPAAVGA
jgi:hypothetical protein